MNQHVVLKNPQGIPDVFFLGDALAQDFDCETSPNEFLRCWSFWVAYQLVGVSYVASLLDVQNQRCSAAKVG